MLCCRPSIMSGQSTSCTIGRRTASICACSLKPRVMHFTFESALHRARSKIKVKLRAVLLFPADRKRSTETRFEHRFACLCSRARSSPETRGVLAPDLSRSVRRGNVQDSILHAIPTPRHPAAAPPRWPEDSRLAPRQVACQIVPATCRDSDVIPPRSSAPLFVPFFPDTLSATLRPGPNRHFSHTSWRNDPPNKEGNDWHRSCETYPAH